MLPAEDTIAAVSSASGLGPRAIVRLSGDRSLSIADRFLATGGPLSKLPGFRFVDGILTLPHEGIEVPTRAYVFRRPRSYTREDLVEFHLPGSPAIASSLMAALIEAGARQAGPGEFTARALFSGRIDLSQAEAVADIINAANGAQLRRAVEAAGGRLHSLCARSTESVTRSLATVEASIDLAEESIELQDASALAGELDAIARLLDRVAREAADMPDSAALPRVVLCGRPNAGKSSLLNALSRIDRAIVSPLAGTTRDVLSQTVSLSPGLPAILVDLAGLGRDHDATDLEASRSARGALGGADAVVVVVDATQPLGEARELLREIRQELAGTPILIAWNKIDLPPAGPAAQAAGELGVSVGRLLGVSAVTGDGLDNLRERLAELLRAETDRPGEAMGLHQRQRTALQAAAEACRRAAELLATADEIADVAELAAVDLRDALAWLGQITGEVVTEDVLGSIFQRFCVGK